MLCGRIPRFLVALQLVRAQEIFPRDVMEGKQQPMILPQTIFAELMENMPPAYSLTEQASAFNSAARRTDRITHAHTRLRPCTISIPDMAEPLAS